MNQAKVIGESRVERKKEKTKQRIIAVAMKLFKEYGVDATTMEQIAMEVDIAKGTLYNYFPVKEAIISEFMQQSFREKEVERVLQFEKEPDTRSRMILIFSTLIEGIQGHKDIFEKYLVYQMQKMVSFRPEENSRSGFHLLGIKVIELGQKSGEIRDDFPIFMLVEMFEFIFIEVVKQLYMEPETFQARESIERYVDLYLQGVKRGE